MAHDQAVAVGEPQPPDARHGYIDAVPVFVNEVPVAVGMHGQLPLLRPHHRTPDIRMPGSVAALVDDQQQQVGEVHHQADRHGDHQVRHPAGISGSEFHCAESFFSSPYHEA